MPIQMAFSYVVLQALPPTQLTFQTCTNSVSTLANILYGTKSMFYIPRYAKIIVILNFMICSLIKQTVAENVRVLGGVSLKMPLQSVIIALTELCDLEMPQGQFVTMYPIELRGTVFYSQQYQRVKNLTVTLLCTVTLVI